MEYYFPYLGYTYWGSDDPDVDYSAWGRRDHSFGGSIDANGAVTPAEIFEVPVYNRHLSRSNNWGRRDYKKYNNIETRGSGGHDHRFLIPGKYEYAIFCPEGYVSEMDIREMKKILHDVSERTLCRMLIPMVQGEFLHDAYSKKFLPLLSDAIRDSVMSVKIKNDYDYLGGWQMFKPSEGFDKQRDKFRYSAAYMGDHWYEVNDLFAETNSPVFAKVGYAGKYFNSIVVGLKNEKMGVEVYDTNYNTRYNNKRLTFTAADDICFAYVFMNFICPRVYEILGTKEIMFDEDLDKAIDYAVAREKAFVCEFYDRLRSSGNDLREVRKQYHEQMVQHFAADIDERIKKKDYGVEMFLPCSFDDFAANGYEVEYVGEDTFGLTSGGKSVFLKVVLYGKKMTPAIMGMINPAQKVDYCPDRFPWPESVKAQ